MWHLEVGTQCPSHVLWVKKIPAAEKMFIVIVLIGGVTAVFEAV